MALVKATISSTIKSALDAEYGAATGDDRQKFCDALATALETIIKAQMQIAVTATIASFGTPTPCLVVVS